MLDENNEDEMKRIVDSANSWCKRKMTENQLAKDTMLQLRKYKAELDEYMDAHNINVDMIELLSGDFSLFEFVPLRLLDTAYTVWPPSLFYLLPSSSIIGFIFIIALIVVGCCLFISQK